MDIMIPDGKWVVFRNEAKRFVSNVYLIQLHYVLDKFVFVRSITASITLNLPCG